MRAWKRYHQKLARLLFFLGCFLLCSQIYGALQGPVAFEEYYSSVIDKIPGYHTRLLSFSEAVHRLDALSRSSVPEEEVVSRVVNLVYESFFHSPFNYDIRSYDNWLYWVIDQSIRIENPRRFLPVMDAEFLWRKGGGWCGQATLIFTSLMNQLGYKTRHFINPKHYISEVYMPSIGWITVDADYGIFWNVSFEDLAKHQSPTVIQEAFVERGWSREYAESLARVYQHPPVPWEQVIIDRSMLVSLQANTLLLSYLIPLLFLIYGWIFGGLRARKTVLARFRRVRFFCLLLVASCLPFRSL